MYEFINSLRNENNIYIISGILNYRNYLTLPHFLLLGNTALFIIPINILIYNILSLEYAYSFNIFSFLLLLLFYIHYDMIIKEQKFTFENKIIYRKIKNN